MAESADPEAETAPMDAVADRPDTEVDALAVTVTDPNWPVMPGAVTLTLMPVATVTDPTAPAADRPVTDTDTFCGTVTEPTPPVA